MRRSVAAALLAGAGGLAVAAPAARADSTATGDMGDRLQVALPSAVLFASALRRDWQGVGQFGRGLAVSLATSYSLKGLITKGRPDGNGHNAFPSAHSAVVFHSATHVHRRFGFKRALPLYAAAAWTSYSRVYDDRHDVADVVVGAAIGVTAGALLTRRFGAVEVRPDLAPGYVGLRLSIGASP